MSPLRTSQPIIIESGPDPKCTILFIHGLGTNGAHFTPLVEKIGQALPDPIRFVLPTAPVRPVTICEGQKLSAWFDLLNANFVAREDAQGLRAAEAYLSGLIEAEVGRGIATNRIIIAGFSQGGAISLMTGLRFKHRLGGIAALSGWLPLATELAKERSNAAHETPIFIGHGTMDRVTPLSMAATTQRWLEDCGNRVTWRTYPVGHSIAEEEVVDLTRWLHLMLGMTREMAPRNWAAG